MYNTEQNALKLSVDFDAAETEPTHTKERSASTEATGRMM